MKRDLDLVRSLLLKCEESEKRYFDIGYYERADRELGENDLIMKDWGKERWSEAGVFHLDLLTQAGFIQRSVCEHSDILMFEITWTGYDYLEVVRDEGIWEETKKAVSKSGSGFAIELVKSVALSLAKKQIEEHFGLKIL